MESIKISFIVSIVAIFFLIAYLSTPKNLTMPPEIVKEKKRRSIDPADIDDFFVKIKTITLPPVTIQEKITVLNTVSAMRTITEKIPQPPIILTVIKNVTSNVHVTTTHYRLNTTTVLKSETSFIQLTLPIQTRTLSTTFTETLFNYNNVTEFVTVFQTLPTYTLEAVFITPTVTAQPVTVVSTITTELTQTLHSDPYVHLKEITNTVTKTITEEQVHVVQSTSTLEASFVTPTMTASPVIVTPTIVADPVTKTSTKWITETLYQEEAIESEDTSEAEHVVVSKSIPKTEAHSYPSFLGEKDQDEIGSNSSMQNSTDFTTTASDYDEDGIFDLAK